MIKEGTAMTEHSLDSVGRDNTRRGDTRGKPGTHGIKRKAHLTDHGRDRLRKRAKAKGESATKAASKAWNEGLSKYDVNGELRRYLDSIAVKVERTVPRIWAGQVFVFTEKAVLVTVFPIPGNLFGNAVAALKRKKHAKQV
jgi:hypothetical protein